MKRKMILTLSIIMAVAVISPMQVFAERKRIILPTNISLRENLSVINGVYDLTNAINNLHSSVLPSFYSKIHFINTGNSDSILIDGVKKVLIDAGNNDDEQLIPDYLKRHGIKKLDYVIATHPHEDHIGGLDGVFNDIKVENLFAPNGSANSKTYRDFIEAAANQGVYPSVPLEGEKIDLGDGAYMQIYNTNGGKTANEKSLVTLYTHGKDTALFMGDAEKGTEKEIINELPDVDLLKLGHHGSRTSSTEKFLDKVNPEIAVITTGLGNKYGHPNKETMEKLKDRKITVHRTDECGDIVFISTGHGLETVCKIADFKYGR